MRPHACAGRHDRWRCDALAGSRRCSFHYTAAALSNMSVCCIGGICIPYTAIIPLLLLGLRWLAEKLARLGLLPESVVHHLGLAAVAAQNKPEHKKDDCCANTNTTKSGDNVTESKLVHSVESMEDWTAIQREHDILVVKFTAAWCKPCRQVAPLFSELSEKYQHAHFVKVDVDELDEVAAQHKVAVMPTFVVIKTDNGVRKSITMRGSNPHKLASFVEEHVSNVGE